MGPENKEIRNRVRQDEHGSTTTSLFSQAYEPDDEVADADKVSVRHRQLSSNSLNPDNAGPNFN